MIKKLYHYSAYIVLLTDLPLLKDNPLTAPKHDNPTNIGMMKLAFPR